MTNHELDVLQRNYLNIMKYLDELKGDISEVKMNRTIGLALGVAVGTLMWVAIGVAILRVFG